MQSKIAELPQDTFVRFYTGIIDKNGETKDSISSSSTPFILFQTNSSEQFTLEKELGKNGDILKLSLKENGKLDEDKINTWFDKLLNFYNIQN